MNLSKQVWEHTFLKPFLQILSPSNCLLEYTVPLAGSDSHFRHVSNMTGGVMDTKTPDILELSVEERIQMVEDIWDSIAAVPEAVSLSEEQKKELDRRLGAYHRNPDAGSPWIEVRKRIRNRSAL